MPSGFSRTSAEQGVGASADTISNYSRPSRVKKYQDTESELSYHSGVSSSNSFAHQNMSASQQFPQPYAPYPGYPPMGLPMGPPMMGMPYPTKHRSGSSIGSHDNMQPGWHSQSDSKWVTPSVSPPPPPLLLLFPQPILCLLLAPMECTQHLCLGMEGTTLLDSIHHTLHLYVSLSSLLKYFNVCGFFCCLVAAGVLPSTNHRGEDAYGRAPEGCCHEQTISHAWRTEAEGQKRDS